jgi:hypothetical protein
MLPIIIPIELRNQAVNTEFWVVAHDVKELVLLSVLACLGLGLAWFYEADFFAIFFATAAALAIVEAVRRSV